MKKSKKISQGERQKMIIESFTGVFNKIKRVDEEVLSELSPELRHRAALQAHDKSEKMDNNPLEKEVKRKQAINFKTTMMTDYNSVILDILSGGSLGNIKPSDLTIEKKLDSASGDGTIPFVVIKLRTTTGEFTDLTIKILKDKVSVSDKGEVLKTIGDANYKRLTTTIRKIQRDEIAQLD